MGENSTNLVTLLAAKQSQLFLVIVTNLFQ
jgi:hypothetical protein